MATNEDTDRAADTDEPDDSLAEQFRKQNEEADERDASLGGSSDGDG